MLIEIDELSVQHRKFLSLSSLPTMASLLWIILLVFTTCSRSENVGISGHALDAFKIYLKDRLGNLERQFTDVQETFQNISKHLLKLETKMKDDFRAELMNLKLILVR